MDIRSSMEGLKTLLGVPSPSTGVKGPAKSDSGSASGPVTVNDQATLSAAGTEAAQSASVSDVRMDKVASVQSAIAAGTYSVPAAAVAGKMIDAMIARG